MMVQVLMIGNYRSFRFLHFDEGSGNVAYDSSSYHNDGECLATNGFQDMMVWFGVQ